MKYRVYKVKGFIDVEVSNGCRDGKHTAVKKVKKTPGVFSNGKVRFVAERIEEKVKEDDKDNAT